MFEMVKTIHEALRTQSTLVFCFAMFVVFGSLGGGMAWIVDKAYKNNISEKSEGKPLANVSAPNGIAIGGNNVGTATVNNYHTTNTTYPYEGFFKKVISGGTISVYVLAPQGERNPLYQKMLANQTDAPNLLRAANEASIAEPTWATPHVFAAFAYINMNNTSAAKDELRKAKELVPQGYEYAESYDAHFRHLEEVINRHDSATKPAANRSR